MSELYFYNNTFDNNILPLDISIVFFIFISSIFIGNMYYLQVYNDFY